MKTLKDRTVHVRYVELTMGEVISVLDGYVTNVKKQVHASEYEVLQEAMDILAETSTESTVKVRFEELLHEAE